MSFQHVVNNKFYQDILRSFFSYEVFEVMCGLYWKHVSIHTNHISSAQAWRVKGGKKHGRGRAEEMLAKTQRCLMNT